MLLLDWSVQANEGRLSDWSRQARTLEKEDGMNVNKWMKSLSLVERGKAITEEEEWAINRMAWSDQRVQESFVWWIRFATRRRLRARHHFFSKLSEISNYLWNSFSGLPNDPSRPARMKKLENAICWNWQYLVRKEYCQFLGTDESAKASFLGVGSSEPSVLTLFFVTLNQLSKKTKKRYLHPHSFLTSTTLFTIIHSFIHSFIQ